MPDFINVLPLLEQAVSELRDNELIQSDNIGLFETTSAIEIGEPRMDTGVYTEEEKSFPHLDVFQPLMPSEIVWVMDQMLALEVSPARLGCYDCAEHTDLCIDEMVPGICVGPDCLHLQVYP